LRNHITIATTTYQLQYNIIYINIGGCSGTWGSPKRSTPGEDTVEEDVGCCQNKDKPKTNVSLIPPNHTQTCKDECLDEGWHTKINYSYMESVAKKTSNK